MKSCNKRWSHTRQETLLSPEIEKNHASFTSNVLIDVIPQIYSWVYINTDEVLVSV